MVDWEEVALYLVLTGATSGVSPDLLPTRRHSSGPMPCITTAEVIGHILRNKGKLSKFIAPQRSPNVEESKWLLNQRRHNHSDEDFEVNPGDRIAQLILEKIEEVECEVVEHLSETERGQQGLGSTGIKTPAASATAYGSQMRNQFAMPRRSRKFKNTFKQDFVPFYSACVDKITEFSE